MIVIRDEKDEFLGYFDMQGGKVIISEFTTRSFYDFYIKDFFDSDDIYMFEDKEEVEQ